MKPEVLPDYNSSYTNTSNIENGLFSQPELDQQLKNIISLIQVGLIDPKENPIIIGTPKDDESDKPAKLSICDKLKIIGILVFLIIVTVVVTLCIIYMFACQSLDVQSEIFASYFGLLQISGKESNKSEECLGLIIAPNKLVTSKSCLSEFDIDLVFEKATEKFSFSVLLGLKNYSRKIESLSKHEVFNILPFILFHNSEVIEVDFEEALEAIDGRYSCITNSTGPDLISKDLMCVRGVKANDSVTIEKMLQNNNTFDSELDSENHKILNSQLAFVPNGEKKFNFIGLYENFN